MINNLITFNSQLFLFNSFCNMLCIGRAGVDYPILSAVPYTNFYCDEQPWPGFYADLETRCQGWYVF